MIVTKSGIKVVSYVHTERGLVDCDTLSDAEKEKLGTEIMLRLCNELYRGKAVFYVDEEGEPDEE